MREWVRSVHVEIWPFRSERTKRPLVCNCHSGGYETISSFSKHRKGVTRFVRSQAVRAGSARFPPTYPTLTWSE